MFKLKYGSRNNVVGINPKKIRENSSPRISQLGLAKMMQLAGFDIDNNAIWRIENGERYIIDLEIIGLAKVLGVSYEELLKMPDN